MPGVRKRKDVTCVVVICNGSSAACDSKVQKTLNVVRNRHGSDNILVVSTTDYSITCLRHCKNTIELVWPAHLALPLNRLCTICKTVDEWLSSNASHVIVFVCKAARGPFAMLLAAIRTYNNICASDDQTLDAAALQNYYENIVIKEVNPSQKRYNQYFSGLLLGGIRVSRAPLCLRSITLTGSPRPQDDNLQLFFKIYRGLKCVHSTDIQYFTSANCPFRVAVSSNTELCGDVIIVAYRRVQGDEREVLFRCQFPTYVISSNELAFSKTDLDEACDDPRFPVDVRVYFTFTTTESNDAVFESSKDGIWQCPLTKADSYENFAAQQPDDAVQGEDEDFYRLSLSCTSESARRGSKSEVTTLRSTEDDVGVRPNDLINCHKFIDTSPFAQKPLPSQLTKVTIVERPLHTETWKPANCNVENATVPEKTRQLLPNVRIAASNSSVVGIQASSQDNCLKTATLPLSIERITVAESYRQPPLERTIERSEVRSSHSEVEQSNDNQQPAELNSLQTSSLAQSPLELAAQETINHHQPQETDNCLHSLVLLTAELNDNQRLPTVELPAEKNEETRQQLVELTPEATEEASESICEPVVQVATEQNNNRRQPPTELAVEQINSSRQSPLELSAQLNYNRCLPQIELTYESDTDSVDKIEESHSSHIDLQLLLSPSYSQEMNSRGPAPYNKFGSANNATSNAYTTYERSYVRETVRDSQPSRETASSVYPAAPTAFSNNNNYYYETQVNSSPAKPAHATQKADFAGANPAATTDLDKIIDELLSVSGANATYFYQRSGAESVASPTASAASNFAPPTATKLDYHVNTANTMNYPPVSAFQSNKETEYRETRYTVQEDQPPPRPPPPRESGFTSPFELDSRSSRFKTTLNTEIGNDRRVRSASVEPDSHACDSDLEVRHDKLNFTKKKSQRGTSVPHDHEERNWQVRIGPNGASGYETDSGLNGSGEAHSSYYSERWSEQGKRAASPVGSQHKFLMHQLSAHEHRLIEELRSAIGDSTTISRKPAPAPAPAAASYARSATIEFGKPTTCAACSFRRDSSPLRTLQLTVNPTTGTISSNENASLHWRSKSTAHSTTDGQELVVRDIPLKSDPPITVSISTLRRSEKPTSNEFEVRESERTYTSRLEHNHDEHHHHSQHHRHHSEHDSDAHFQPIRVMASSAVPDDARTRTLSTSTTQVHVHKQSSSPQARNIYTERTIPIQVADTTLSLRRNASPQKPVQVNVQETTTTTTTSKVTEPVVQTITVQQQKSVDKEELKKTETSKTVEVFEEIETIALQPIGKGVQDLGNSANSHSQAASAMNTLSRSMASVHHAGAAHPNSFVEQDIETVALQPIGRGVKDLGTPIGSRSHSQANLAGTLGSRSGLQAQRATSTMRTLQTPKYQTMEGPRFAKSASDLRFQVPQGLSVHQPQPTANFTMMRQQTLPGFVRASEQREQYVNETITQTTTQQHLPMAMSEQRRAMSVGPQPDDMEEVVVASTVKKQQSVGPRVVTGASLNDSSRAGTQLRVDTSSYSPQNGTIQSGRVSTINRMQSQVSPGMTEEMGMRMVNDVMRFWYKPKMPRDEIISILRGKPPGTFLVRDSNSYPGSYGLAVKVAQLPPNVQQKTNDISTELVRHFLIEPTSKGIRLKGCSNEPSFQSLAALIYQHMITPLALPLKLVLPDSDCAPWYNDDGYAKYETKRTLSGGSQPGDRVDNDFMVSETLQSVQTSKVQQSTMGRNVNQPGLLSAAPNFDNLLQNTSNNQAPAQSPDNASLNSAGKDQPSMTYTVLYLGDVDVESLTGPKAIARAVDQLEKQQIVVTDASCKVSPAGVTITDNQRRLFFRKHIPLGSVLYSGFEPQDRRWNTQTTQAGGGVSAKIFGLVARKLSGALSGLSENVCYVFAEMTTTQPVANLIKFTTQMQAQAHSSS